MPSEEKETSEVGAGRGYLTTKSPETLVIHGVALQIASVLLGYISSATQREQVGVVEPTERLFSISWLLGMTSSSISYAGWALVVFGCARVVADSIKAGTKP